MTTIRSLAAEYDAQPYEIAAALDLGATYSEVDDLDAATEAEYRAILDVMREQDERETFVAEYHEVDPTITILHDGEDNDLVIIGREVLPAILDYTDPGEEWRPDLLDEALEAAGWVRVSEWDDIARTAQIRRA